MGRRGQSEPTIPREEMCQHCGRFHGLALHPHTVLRKENVEVSDQDDLTWLPSVLLTVTRGREGRRWNCRSNLAQEWK